MPKDTFFNLPEEKRITIQNAAMQEFADNGFEKASINRIVASAGIAKGSFYQYFEDKVDVFRQVVDDIGEKKMQYVSPVLLNPAEHDFYTLLAELYGSGLEFAKENPIAARVGFEIFENKNNNVFKAMMEENMDKGTAFFEPLLDLAIARGEVDPNIDKSFVIFMMIQMQLSSLEYYFQAKENNDIDDDIMPIIQLMIDFIKNGIGCRTKGENIQ